MRARLLVLSLLTLLGACDDGSEAAPPDAALPVDAGPDLVRATEARAPCADRDPLRNLYWGDLHIHTSLSFDAYVFDVRTTPEESYAFAKGAPARLPPMGEDGVGTQEVQLRRPLDFAAVTDHAEYLAEIAACTTPGSPAYDGMTCVD